MPNGLWVVQCYLDYGDGESGPMVMGWYEIVKGRDVGEAWLRWRNARPITEKEEMGYKAYQREVRKFKRMGFTEQECPFGIEDFVEFEEV